MYPPHKKACKDLADKVAQNVIEFLHGSDMARLRAFEEHFETNKARYHRQLCETHSRRHSRHVHKYNLQAPLVQEAILRTSSVSHACMFDFFLRLLTKMC